MPGNLPVWEAIQNMIEGVNENASDACRLLPCDKLYDNPLRLEFYSQSHIEELVASIGREGLLEPLLVHKGEDGRFIILSGHYRIRAVRRLKHKEVLCRILCCDKKTAAAVYCTANRMTRGLSAIEEAHIITGLITSEGYTLEEAGVIFGKSATWVCRRVKLLKLLSPKLKEELGRGGVKPRTAQELARLPQGNEQERVFLLVKKNSLTKDETAKLVDRWLLADENGRREIEDEIMSKNGAVKDMLRCMTDPGKSLGAGFRQCTSILEKLYSYLDCLKPPYTFWPWEEYHDFMHAVEKISAAYTHFTQGRVKAGVTHNAAAFP